MDAQRPWPALEWTVGDVTVCHVVEQEIGMPALAYLPRATPDGLARHEGWAQPWALRDDGTLRLWIQGICVQSAGRQIVVDTCVGRRPLPERIAWLEGDGAWLDALAAAGFHPDAVDTVICTHLHVDHVGWNTIRVGDAWVPTFPNARYLLARPAYEAWRADAAASAADRPMADADTITPLFEHGVVDLVDVDHQVTESVFLTPTPGHAPGHVSVRVRSHAQEAFITGDCVHSPLQLVEPDWFSLADMDPDEADATRRRVVAELLDRDVLVVGTHFPAPVAGHLVSTDEGPRFRPVA